MNTLTHASSTPQAAKPIETTPPAIVVLAAVSPTLGGDDVVRTAALLAQSLANVELHLVEVVEPTMARVGPDATLLADGARTEQEAAEQAQVNVGGLRERAQAWFDGEIVAHVAFGSPTAGVLEIAERLRADVIVVGSHPKGAVERFILGSVSEEIARKASCAVLVARPKSYPPEPVIEPPCPDCLAARAASNNAEMWCTQHAGPAIRTELHYETPASFGIGSTFLRP